jgi:PST family polysaccharide transporter
MAAVGWTTGAKLFDQVVGFGLSVVLMRLLGPEAFGLIGMVLVFSGFAAIFSELGFSSALVQRQELREEHKSTIFWVNLGMAGSLTLVMYLAAPWIAAFYREPMLEDLAAWLSLTFVISAPGMVPRALIQKQLRFDLTTKVHLVSVVVSGIAGVGVAMLGGGVWSLVVKQLAGNCTSSLMLAWRGGWCPRMIWSRQAVRELFGYGAGLTGFNIINYWARSADNLLVGKFMGTEALGFYARAYSLMLLPLTQVVSVVAPVLFPALSTIQDDKARVRRAYLRVMDLLTFATFPLMLGLAAVAEPFVLGVFGQKWAGVTPIIQILAFVGITQTVCNPTGWLYKSQGRTDWMFWWGLGGSGFLILSIVVGVMLGSVTTVAWAYLVGNLIITIPCIAIPGSLVGMTVLDVWRSVRGNLACASGMAVAVAGLSHLLPAELAPLIRLLILIGAGAVGYGFLAWLSRQTALLEIWRLGQELMARKAAAPC